MKVTRYKGFTIYRLVADDSLIPPSQRYFINPNVKQIPAPISKSPPVVPSSPKPDDRQITIDRLQNELKQENQKSITFKSEIEQLRSELEKLKGDNQQLIMEKEMLSAGLEQKSHESLETSEKLEEINTELLKTQVELTAERQKTDENQAQFDSEIEVIKSTLRRVELESTERQQRLDHAQQCLADEQERYKRLASNSSDNALTEAESKIEDLKEIGDLRSLRRNIKQMI